MQFFIYFYLLYEINKEFFSTCYNLYVKHIYIITKSDFLSYN